MNNPPTGGPGSQPIDPSILQYAQGLNGEPLPPAQPPQNFTAADQPLVVPPPGFVQPPPVRRPTGYLPPQVTGIAVPPPAQQPFFQSPQAWNKPETKKPDVEFVPPAGAAGAGADVAKTTPDKVVIPPSYNIPAHNIPLVDPALQGNLPIDPKTGQPITMQGAIAGEAKSVEGQELAAIKVGKAEANQSLETAKGIVGEEEAQLNAKLSTEHRSTERTKELKAYEERYRTAVDKMASYSLDPNRYMKSLSTFDNMRMGLASILGGFYQGWTGRNNPALDELHHRQSLDIQAQQSDYERMKDKTEAQRTLYSIAREHEDDKDKALALANQMGITQAQLETKRLAAASGSPTAMAKADSVIAALESKKAEYAPLAVQEKIRENKYAQATSGGGVNMQAVRDLALKVYKEQKTPITYEQALRLAMANKGVLVPGSEPLAVGGAPLRAGQANTKAIDAANAVIQSADEVIKINNRLNDLSNKSGILTAAERSEMDQLLRNGQLHYPRAQTGSTRINEAELEAGRRTYTGEGGLYRGDPLGSQAARLGVITQQMETRKKEAQARLRAAQTGGGEPAPEHEAATDEELGISAPSTK